MGETMNKKLSAETESYNLGWADCEKRIAEPLREERNKLLSAAKRALLTLEAHKAGQSLSANALREAINVGTN